MEEYKYVFIVLVYINGNDLEEFIESINCQVSDSFKIVIVNSYYDNLSEEKIKSIAEEFDCDFISVENKGYSYGNNIGIEHASKNYKYDYIIISNPDIIITKWNEITKNTNPQIIAPAICTKRGKKQNPNWAIDCHIANKFIYIGYKNNNKIFLILGIGINKIIRGIFNILFKLFKAKEWNVYSPHGSFIIFNKKAIFELKPIFDENVFLFSEEAILAKKAKINKIQTKMTSKIKVLHKEDGSVSLSNINENKELAKSYIYYFEKYEKSEFKE